MGSVYIQDFERCLWFFGAFFFLLYGELSLFSSIKSNANTVFAWHELMRQTQSFTVIFA